MFTGFKINYLINKMTAAGLTIIILAGCSSKNVVSDTSTGTFVSVTVSPSTVQTNSTAIVEATITSGSSALPSRIVNFTVAPPGSGYFTPSSDTTDATGVAATIFTATVSGSVNVIANVQGTSSSGVRAITITNSPQTGSGNVTISVSPSLLLANGADTSIVTITVRNAQTQLAPDGTAIKLTAGEKFSDLDGNGYWTPNIDSLIYDANPNGQWDAIGLIPSTTNVAGGAGAATVSYVSGNSALTVYVRATVDDNGISGYGEVPLQLSPDATINSIYLNSNSIQLAVKGTGGIETGFIHATCYDSKGNRVPENIAVSFIITDGPGRGVHLENVGNGPYAAVTNTQGVATVTIHSGTVSGTVRIRAYADTILSNATQILISAGPPAYIVVGAEACNVPYWNNVAEVVEIVAIVSDIYLNPVIDSTVVYFSTDEGTMKSQQSRTQNNEGIVTTVWFSGNNVSTADGVVRVMAETAGGTVADTSFFYNTHVPDTVWAVGVPLSLPADEGTKAIVTVYGLDLNRNFVFEPTAIDADARILEVAGGSLSDGCNSSNLRTEITSKLLTMDESLTGADDNGIGAVDQVTYWSSSGAGNTYNINLTTGAAYRPNCELQVQATAFLGEVVSIYCLIKDFSGNPLGDHTLVMTSSLGTIQNGTQETNGFGEANGFIWTAPAVPGNVTITVVDQDPRGGLTLTAPVIVQ